ncbi:MAG: hypothetical protein ILA17_09535 [Ruminococcus sp.]|nr:hypothetical protein [Ruminococcus sp.]
MSIEYKAYGKTKLAVVWLTNQDQKEGLSDEAINRLISQRFKVVICRSGKEELSKGTEQLIKQNCKA